MSIIKLIRNKIGKSLLHDSIILEGTVEIINGNTHLKFKNSIVDQGLINIINILSIQTNNALSSVPSNNFAAVSTQSFIALGSDTTTPTTHSTTALTAQIGAPTKANTQSGVTNNPSTGVFNIQWIATWNPGSISGVLGELGLFLNLFKTLQVFNAGAVTPTAGSLFSRSASADGKFTSFTIDTTKPLSIIWTLTSTYTT